jgi:hypothetical protein
MKVIFEKRSLKDEIFDGKTEKVSSVEVVEKKEEATHEHICFHDEDNPRPCILKPLK